MLFQLIDAGVFCWRPRAYGSALLLLVVKQSRGMLCLKALASESSAGQGKELQLFNDMPHPWHTLLTCVAAFPTGRRTSWRTRAAPR